MKERGRIVQSFLPYAVLPKVFVIHLIYFVVFWLNAFYAKNGISEEFSPREIVLCRSVEFNKYCKGMFGLYVEAGEDANVTNDMRPRTYSGILLGPSSNIQGTPKVFDLKTGKV